MISVKKEVNAYRAHLTISNFKSSSVSAYCRTLELFLIYCQQEFPDVSPGQQQVQAYLLTRLNDGKSWSSINVDYSSLRKYFIVLKDFKWSLKKFPRPRKDDVLPAVLSKEQVAKLINAAPNFKYQVFLTLLYATGMRLSEACHLKISDIDSERMQIRISLGKGGKDRLVQLPPILLPILRSYFVAYRPSIYLFNGRKKGLPYSASSGQWAIKRARVIAGIDKKCSIHTLRNCFATHHLELGTDLVYLKEQLGHKHLKTTAKYIRLCVERYRQINHPIDHIQLIYLKPKIT